MNHLPTCLKRRLAAALALAPALACAGANLVANGSFDKPEPGLAHWKYRYELEGESWYFENHARVSVVPQEGPQKNVLALWGDYAILQAPGQGTKVDSAPIPVEKGGRYRATVRARTTGPDCQIRVEGYFWKPGVKPHPDPELHELRKCYRSKFVYFGKTRGGTAGGVGRQWETASLTFPDKEISALERSMFDKAEFLVVHIVAIKGSEGYLYVDDVELERVP